MSHEATNWAIKQRGLPPTTKIILWHLADRHNPDFGCFPSQVRLAEDAEVSRATLNRHLDDLEARQLLRRVQSIDPDTKRQRNTRYILAYEAEFSPDAGPDGGEPGLNLRHGTEAEQDEKPCLKSGHGAVSQNDAKPCLKNAESRVSNRDTNLVREPLSKPVSAREARARGCEDHFDEFWEAYPNPIEETAAKRAWEQVATAENASLIITAAKAYRDDRRVKAGFAKSPANWLRDRGWEAVEAQKPRTAGPVDLDALSDMWAPKIAAGSFVPSSAISAALAHRMLTTGAVTADQLRKAGVRA